MKLSRLVTALLAVALMTFMVSDALGQGRPRGQGGQGGRGGPGGGFGGRGGTSLNGTIFTLLRVDEVKKEIDLMSDQEEAIGKISERSRGERPNIDFRNASDEDRTAFFEKMQKEGKERSKKMAEQLEEVLFPEQMERVKEIAIQQLGVQALTEETVATELKLTTAQKEEIKETIAKASTERREKAMDMFRAARGGGGGERGERGEGGGRPPRGEGGAGGPGAGIFEAIAKMREESDKKVLAVLTSTQKTELEAMKGEKFDMPERRGFGGFGGGRGGDGGFGGRGRGGDGGAGGRGRPQRPAAEDDE